MSDVIPAEAVEAAARLLCRDYGVRVDWERLPECRQDQFLTMAAKALEAAAPHMLRDAYSRGFDDGHLAGQESMETE